MEPVIGIDLGTTYSAVATVEGGQPVIIPTRSGARLTPSVVGFTPSGERVVGERARLVGDEAPERIAPATKRYIGRRWSPELAASARSVVPYPLIAGPSGEVRVKVAGRILPLTQVSAEGGAAAADGRPGAASSVAPRPARKRRRSIAIEAIEPHREADRRRQLLSHQVAHLLDVGEQGLDLRAGRGIADRGSKRQRYRRQRREHRREALGDLAVERLGVGGRR